MNDEAHAASLDASRAVEWAARSAYGRLIATMASRTRDVAAAEDALSDAFLSAMQQWPIHGVPDHPDAWLLSVARRRIADRARRRAVHDRVAPAFEYATLLAQPDAPDDSPVLPDQRAALLFACAHPAIDPALHAPLMLQVVLGLEAEQIAAAFLVKPSAMAQRLVRGKRKLRDAGIRFALPEAHELPARLPPVLDAIYAAFGTAWDAVAGGDHARGELATEAIWLARVMHAALPGDAEAIGLLSLMLYCDARRDARVGSEGEYIPLDEQDVATWNHVAIDEAELLLVQAARLLSPGRFQTEAAIQSLHVARRRGHAVDRDALVTLYDALFHFAPTVGVAVNRSAALAQAGRTTEALATLRQIPEQARATYQPWWVLQAHVLALIGDGAGARAAYEQAIGLTVAPGVRTFLLEQLAAVQA